MKRERMNINGLWTKVVKGEEGWNFVQVVENVEKIKALIAMTHQAVVAWGVTGQRTKAGVVRPEAGVYYDPEKNWSVGEYYASYLCQP